MKRSVLFYTVLFLLAYALHTFAADWTPIAEKLSKSVVYIESAKGACTGFVINSAAKNDKDYVLTAAHCAAAEMFVDHALARIVWKDSKSDLLIMEVDDLDRPAVVLALKDPQQGQEIVSFGYGLALEGPMFRHAYVANASISIPDVEGGPFVMIDAGYVNGQSGGPCINVAGDVVSIVQQANGLLGIGVGAEKIRSKVGRYLEKPKVKP